MDYSNQDIANDRNSCGQIVKRIDVCTQPFYAMYVRSTGDVVPCCVDVGNLIIGNVADEGLYEIWNGEKLRELRRQHLARKRWENSICGKCKFPSHGMQEKDRIDQVADALYEKMFPDSP